MSGIIARADLERLTSRYRSKAEEWWATFGPAILEGELRRLNPEAAYAVVITEYEPVTLHMAGNDYTPDFLHILSDGRMVFVEVKAPLAQRNRAGKRAFRGQQNMRDARSKLREAAESFPYWQFVEVRKFLDGNLEIELIANGRPTT